ncbi:MAG: phasin family protein [Gammaproteobacteria bacterium]
MITKIEKLARNVRAEYGTLTNRAIKRIRNATLDTAEMVSSSRTPVRKFTDAGLQINRISHKGLEKLVKQQANFVDSAIEGGARRLELAARADSLRALVGDQISMLPKSRHWAVLNARKTIEIVKDAGDEIGGVLRATVVVPNKARKTTKKTAKKSTRKVAARTRRPAAKKATTRKAAAKKTTAKKRVVKKTASKKASVRKNARTTARKVTRKGKAQVRKVGAAIEKIGLDIEKAAA